MVARGSLVWTAFGASLAAVALSARPALAATPNDAEDLIRRGNELRRVGQDGAALPLFQRAYDSTQTPRTAAQLGLCQLQLGYVLEAEQHLSEALEAQQDYWIRQNRPVLEGALVRARAQIGEVAVSGSPDGAAVSVNGRGEGTLPLQRSVRVREGTVRVDVRAAGFRAGSASVTVIGGRRARVTLDLVREPGLSRVVAASPAEPGPPSPPVLVTAARPRTAPLHRGRFAAMLRVNAALPLQEPFAVLEPGLVYGVTNNVEAVASALLGHYRGGALGVRWLALSRVLTPVIALDVPAFVVEGHLFAGVHGSVGLQWDPLEHVGLFIEVGSTFFPGAASDLRAFWVVTAVGTQIRF